MTMTMARWCALSSVSAVAVLLGSSFEASAFMPSVVQPLAGQGGDRAGGRTGRSYARGAGPMRMSSQEEEPQTRRDVVAPMFEDQCDLTGITLSRFMVEAVAANPHLHELDSIILSVQTACKTIASVVDRAPLSGLLGLESGGGSINVQGEEQKKLDLVTNDILKKALKYSGKVGTLASEEEDEPEDMSDVNIQDKYRDVGLKTTSFNKDVIMEETAGKYVAVFDPLDGSSNVDAGIPTGTIFGIFDEDKKAAEECKIDQDGDVSCLAQTLQPGSSLVAAGYCLYSSSVFFTLTIGNGVNVFTLDRQIGEFVLTNANIQIPKRGKIYSFNEANRWTWDKPLAEYVTAIQTGAGETKQQYAARYIGSMVGDVHRTLLYGGIFGYPATTKNPDGKLRLLYEAAPMSFLVEQAGGTSLTGKNRIMDISPTSVHQRVPCIMGSTEDVMEARKYYEASDDPELIARCLKRMSKTAKATA